MNRDDVIDTVLKMYYKYGFPVRIDKSMSISEEYSLKETFDISCDFLKQYDEDIYNMFLNIRSFDKNAYQYKTLETNIEAENEYNVFTKSVSIVPTYTIADVYSQCHELVHKIDAPSDFDKSNLDLSEVAPMTLELFINEYLADNDISYEESMNYIYNRMIYAVDNAYFIKYIEFLKSLKLGVFSIFLNANPAIFKAQIIEHINELPDYLKYNFLENCDEYNRILARFGYLIHGFDSKTIYRYINAFFLAPYLFAKNDHELIKTINRASYDTSINIPEIDYNEVIKYLDKHFKLLKSYRDYLAPTMPENLTNVVKTK